MLVLQLEPDLVSNTYAEQILDSYESEQEFCPTQQRPQTGYAKQNDIPRKAKHKKGLLSSSERKTLEQLYSRGPASFGGLKRLLKHSKLS